MTSPTNHRSFTVGGTIRPAAFAFLLALALSVTTSQVTQAQTFSVVHNFTGGQDGATPWVGLTMDEAGNFYGDASAGGSSDFGVVFKLTQKNASWIFTPLYSFQGGNDGSDPQARVIIGPDGSLYGTTTSGGTGCNGCGTIFNLRPQPSACSHAICAWNKTVLYSFSRGDGFVPSGDIIFDQAGAIYGTTSQGGAYGWGAVYKLTPSGGSWTESVLYNFTGGNDGANPLGGVIFDQSGRLHGTAYSGGLGGGVIFQLTPVGSGWSDDTLYTFQSRSDGGGLWGGLITDKLGNLYGATLVFGSGGGGTVYELTPVGRSGWEFTVLNSFTGSTGPLNSNLVMDAAGNLYGTTYNDGAHNLGSVFKLTPSGGGWTYTDLHDFTGGSDGGKPQSNVTFDANGNLYGTASEGGTGSQCNGGCGVVWEITP
ncbi:MAG: choice-of-anchor tandem repeat GloVer-containing protein [Candidatus Korobacteraceae bacterium]|jgi:uncharacterized repeat protein (TIGR03803 family)